MALPMKTGVRGVASRRSAVVVRASAPSSSKETRPVLYSEIPVSERFFSPEQWDKAIKAASPSNSTAAGVPAAMATHAQPAPAFGEVMAFSGPAPETINGRLAMLGFTAALFTEVSTGAPVVQQLQDATLPVVLGSLAFVGASFVPIAKGANLSEGFGPFDPQAEILNGRFAMMGFALLVWLELSKNAPFFTFSA